MILRKIYIYIYIMKVEQIIMLVIAFLLGYQFKNICGQKVVEGVYGGQTWDEIIKVIFG